MYLPHLKIVKKNREWEDKRRARLKAVLLEFVDAAGPQYVLDVLAEARAEWGGVYFETAELQRDYCIEVIQEAADRCRRISAARFAIEDNFGRNPTFEMFEALLNDEEDEAPGT